MKNYMSFNVRKEKCLAPVAGLEKHIERLSDEYESNPEIISDMTDANYHLIEPESGYCDYIQKRLNQENIKIRKNNIICDFLSVTAPYEIIGGMNETEQREFFEYALDFMIRRCGRENIISAVVHMDESKPHMHCVIVPILDGKLNSSALITHFDVFHQFLADYHCYMAERYTQLDVPPIEQIGRSTHVPLGIYKMSADVVRRFQEIGSEVENMTVLNMKEVRKKTVDGLYDLLPEIAALKSQLDTSGKYIDEICLENARLERELSSQRSRQSDRDKEKGELESEIENLSFEVYRLRNLIRLVPKEIQKEYFKGPEQFAGIMELPEGRQI